MPFILKNYSHYGRTQITWINGDIHLKLIYEFKKFPVKNPIWMYVKLHTLIMKIQMEKQRPIIAKAIFIKVAKWRDIYLNSARLSPETGLYFSRPKTSFNHLSIHLFIIWFKALLCSVLCSWLWKQISEHHQQIISPQGVPVYWWASINKHNIQ